MTSIAGFDSQFSFLALLLILSSGAMSHHSTALSHRSCLSNPPFGLFFRSIVSVSCIVLCIGPLFGVFGSCPYLELLLFISCLLRYSSFAIK